MCAPQLHFYHAHSQKPLTPKSRPGTLLPQLARTTASLSQLRAEHGKLTWAVWRAEQDVKDGDVERLAAVARRVAAEEGLKP
jgi:hypothetical protein